MLLCSCHNIFVCSLVQIAINSLKIFVFSSFLGSGAIGTVPSPVVCFKEKVNKNQLKDKDNVSPLPGDEANPHF